MNVRNQTHKYIDFDFVGLRSGSAFTPIRHLAEAKNRALPAGEPGAASFIMTMFIMLVSIKELLKFLPGTLHHIDFYIFGQGNKGAG